MNPYPQIPSSLKDEQIKKALFSNAMEGEWDEVINIYEQRGESAHKAKITRSGDTAVHIAISDGREEIAEKLVRIASHTPGALAIENELGNTPLHLAASLGNVRMCQCIASQDSKLISIRNKDNETPFFLAVHHGRETAFLCLHSFCENGEGYEYCRKDDGETILHSAISGGYFDIAFQITHLYDELRNSVNGQGLSPLHLLASMPSAFRSGSHIGGFKKLIYDSIFVDELQQKSSCHTPPQEHHCGVNEKYPKNYQTCADFVLLLRNIIWKLMGYSTNQNSQQQDAEGQQSENKQAQRSSMSKAQGRQFPDNYLTCFRGLKLISKAMRAVFRIESMQIVVKLRDKKQKHILAVQVMEELLEHSSLYKLYEDNGRSPHHLSLQKDGETMPVFIPESSINPPTVQDDDNASLPAAISSKADQENKEDQYNVTTGNGNKEKVLEMEKRETPLLIAAKNGIMEMVERILERFPAAILDQNNEKRNIVLLAAENRQPQVYQFLLGQKIKMKDAIFQQRDKDGNGVLHLAAMLGHHRHCFIPGAALQLQWEFKWYKFVNNSMPLHFFARYNNKGQTPRDIFSETHQHLVKEGSAWLTNTSVSCSVVAALIATVAFATSATIPGGVNSDSGTPILAKQPAFRIFAISSLIALCYSITSLAMFLAIITSRHQEKDFRKVLLRRLRVGLTCLFLSVASILVSFCAGHSFVLNEKPKYATLLVYAITCLPVMLFSVAQFPWYFQLVLATFRKVPPRIY